MADLKYWEMASGGETGSLHIDASVSTTTVTGQIGLIDVLSTAVFTILTGQGNWSAMAIDFRVDNNLSGVVRQPGLLWPGYGRYFSTIKLSGGQIAYYLKRDD